MKPVSDRAAMTRLLAGAAPLALSLAAFSSPAQAIVTNDNVTPEEAVDDEEEFTGVGMFFRADGFVCSGTLINPRTVLFAAHCVNNVPEETFAQQLPAAFSFNVNALPGFQNWFANSFASNPDLNVFNVNRIYWHTDSVRNPQAQGFLEADVAIASLDTPAANLPTWSLLFSPLPTPDAITDADGTGYHVNITGYGRSGQGTVGAVNAIDWRRRSAENMLGALASFDDRNTFLFGGPAGLPQNLYRLDFDDPNMANPFDFNLWKDEPRANEGTTAGGDSGGPLILDAANNAITDEDLVIGVLSGGSRFFFGQGFSTYGTESFYQPLYLFWDYIAANNPYRYVAAKAGDGNWESEGHWETTLDPNYRVINADGAIVNGIPTSPGNGITGEDPTFGEVCFDPRGPSAGHVCQDLATGDFTPPAREDAASLLGGADSVSGIGTVDVGAIGGGNQLSGEELSAIGFTLDPAQFGPEFAQETPQAIDGGAPEFSASPNPTPTLANGLPGATNFVPNNIDPVISSDPSINVDPRYFDVTLAADGTTTLNSSVTIDRLTVRNNAGLFIRDVADLTSLIDVSQFGGSVLVDGALTSVGDYTLFAGFLGGNGTLTAPFVTNIMGAISPGRTGQIGTFTIDGDAVLSSGSTLLVDIGPNGASDALAVTGDVSIGGVVAVGQGITGVVNGNGVQYTILTAGGGILDSEGAPVSTFTEGTISTLLSQSFTYLDDAVLMEIIAGSYADVVDGTDPVQVAYAQLLDQNRSNAAVSGLYGLDFASADTIRSTLNGLAPVGETAVRSLTAQGFQHMMNFNRGRLASSTRDSNGGTMATLGNPLGAAEAGFARFSQPGLRSDLALADGYNATDVKEGAVPDNMAIFFAGGFIEGEGASMPGFQMTDTDFDGYFLAGGLEIFPSANSMIGGSVYHSNLEADVVLGGSAETEMWAGSFYGRATTKGGLIIDGQMSFSRHDTETSRTVAFLGNTETLMTDDNSGGFSAGLGLSYDVPVGGLTLTPGIEGRYSTISYGRVDETQGVTALSIERERFKSLQGRVGFDASTAKDKAFKLNLTADYVHEFEDGPQVFQANFRNGIGAPAAFELATTDQNWFEVGVGASVDAGPIELGVGFDSTIGRDNADAQTYTASATIRF